MSRRPLRALAAMLLLLGACSDDGSSATTASVPVANTEADCRPRTLTFEPAVDESATVQPVLSMDDASLIAAVAATFCVPEWVQVFPDGSTQRLTARTVLPADEAGCIGDGLVGTVGGARAVELGLGVGPWSLAAFGLTGANANPPIERLEAEAITGVFTRCATAWKLLLILSVTEGAEQIGDSSAGCVAERITDDDAAEMLTGEIDRRDLDPSPPPGQGDAGNLEQLVAAYDACLTPEERDHLDFN